VLVFIIPAKLSHKPVAVNLRTSLLRLLLRLT